MNENQLIELCSDVNAQKGYAPWFYWPAELYSHGKIIRKMGLYPSFLPLCVYGDHSSGVVGTDVPAKHELETDAPAYLTFSKEKARIWSEMTSKRAHVIMSPAVWYRRKMKIRQSKNHRGTVAFCVHSVPGTDTIVDYVKYARSLLELPENFQPVTVCLHMHDVNLGLAKVFLDEGLDVVTAGNTLDYRFIDRFYGILRNYSFATSNFIGTYTVLATEMGIPFFMHGDSVAFNNHQDKNIPIGLNVGYDGYPYFQSLHDSFTFQDYDVKIENKILRDIEERLGIYDSISRIKLSMALWKSLIYVAFRTQHFQNHFKMKLAAARRKLFIGTK